MINSLWAAYLQEASFRGINFQVSEYEYDLDRRTVTHEFPFRDLPLIEDLGLGLQRISINGYLIGDDVFGQRDQLAQATKTAGQGELVHPSLGSLTATLTSASFAERADEGRMVSVHLNFIVSDDAGNGDTFWQLVTVSGPGAIQNDALEVHSALVGDFSLRAVSQDAKAGLGAVSGVARQAQGYVSTVKSVIGDASRLVHAADGLGSILTGLRGSRYERRATGTALDAVNRVLNPVSNALGSVNRITAGTNQLISAANQSYSDVVRAGDTMSQLADAL